MKMTILEKGRENSGYICQHRFDEIGNPAVGGCEPWLRPPCLLLFAASVQFSDISYW